MAKHTDIKVGEVYGIYTVEKTKVGNSNVTCLVSFYDDLISNSILYITYDIPSLIKNKKK